MKSLNGLMLASALFVSSIALASEPPAEPSPGAGTAVSTLIATLTAAPSPFALAMIAVQACGDESPRCLAVARRVFRASRVVARVVSKSGGGGFAAYVRRQPNVVAAVFRAIAVARAEWTLRHPPKTKKRLPTRVVREGEKVLLAALVSGRIPGRLAPDLQFLRAFVSRKAGPTADDAMAFGSGSVPVGDPTATAGPRPADTVEPAPRAAPRAAIDAAIKGGKEALPNFVWRRGELDARDTDKVPLKRIIAELKGIADIVNKGLPLGGGVSIRPDKVEGHWGVRIMGVFLEEDEGESAVEGAKTTAPKGTGK
jgi:hypothetical protein